MSLAVAACAGAPLGSPRPGGPSEIASELVRHGIRVREVVSGDPGCDDPSLADNAVRIEVLLPEDAASTSVFVLNFRNQATYDAAAAVVEACRRALEPDATAADRSALDVPPYRAYGAGWTEELTKILRQSLDSAARGEAGQ